MWGGARLPPGGVVGNGPLPPGSPALEPHRLAVSAGQDAHPPSVRHRVDDHHPAPPLTKPVPVPGAPHGSSGQPRATSTRTRSGWSWMRQYCTGRGRHLRPYDGQLRNQQRGRAPLRSRAGRRPLCGGLGGTDRPVDGGPLWRPLPARVTPCDASPVTAPRSYLRVLATARLQLRKNRSRADGTSTLCGCVQTPRRTHVTMFIFPLFLGMVSLALGLATRNNYRGFRDWLV